MKEEITRRNSFEEKVKELTLRKEEIEKSRISPLISLCQARNCEKEENFDNSWNFLEEKLKEVNKKASLEEELFKRIFGKIEAKKDLLNENEFKEILE